MKIYVDAPKRCLGSLPYLNVESSQDVTATLRELLKITEGAGRIHIRVEGYPTAAESRADRCPECGRHEMIPDPVSVGTEYMWVCVNNHTFTSREKVRSL